MSGTHSTLDQDGLAAQASAMRISAMAAAIFPTDRNLFSSYADALVPDLMSLALHGRRVMEGRNVVDTSLAEWGFWPGSSQSNPDGVNLHDAFGHILHSHEIELGWEKFTGEIAAYTGRECRFLGHVKLKSTQKSETYVLGSIAASFLCGVTDALSKNQKGK